MSQEINLTDTQLLALFDRLAPSHISDHDLIDYVYGQVSRGKHLQIHLMSQRSRSMKQRIEEIDREMREDLGGTDLQNAPSLFSQITDFFDLGRSLPVAAGLRTLRSEPQADNKRMTFDFEISGYVFDMVLHARGPQDDLWQLRGRVNQNFEPLVGCGIALSQDGLVTCIADTDSTGQFLIEQVPRGDYTMHMYSDQAAWVLNHNILDLR